jgi:hypothetical protein
MDTRFVYTAGAGITAAFSPNSIRRAPTTTSPDEDGYLLIERPGYQRGDYILSVIVDCARLPATEMHLVSVQVPNTMGDPDIYFVPGVGVSARENRGAMSAAVALPASGLAKVTYTILRSTGVGSLVVDLSTGSRTSVDATMNWATGGDNHGQIMALMHKSVIDARFFWSD